MPERLREGRGRWDGEMYLALSRLVFGRGEAVFAGLDLPALRPTWCS